MHIGTNFIFRARFDQVALNEETFVVSANYVPHIDYLLMHTDYIAKELVFATIPLAPDDLYELRRDYRMRKRNIERVLLYGATKEISKDTFPTY